MPVFTQDCMIIDIKRFIAALNAIKSWIPHFLLETAVELARRKAVVEPKLVVPQGYQNRLQHLIPIYLTNMKKPDLAMTLSVMDGYYLGNTYLTLEIAYLNARMIARPTAGWLTDLVK